MNTTTTAVAEEVGDDNDVVADDGDNKYEADDTKGGRGRDPEVKYGNSDDNKEDVVGVLPPPRSL